MASQFSTLVFAGSHLSPSVGEDFFIPPSKQGTYHMDYTGAFDDFSCRRSAIQATRSPYPPRGSSRRARRRLIWTVRALLLRLETIVEEI